MGHMLVGGRWSHAHLPQRGPGRVGAPSLMEPVRAWICERTSCVVLLALGASGLDVRLNVRSGDPVRQTPFLYDNEKDLSIRPRTPNRPGRGFPCCAMRQKEVTKINVRHTEDRMEDDRSPAGLPKPLTGWRPDVGPDVWGRAEKDRPRRQRARRTLDAGAFCRILASETGEGAFAWAKS